MSDADVELIKSVYERWSQGDFHPQPEVYDHSLEWGYSEEFPDLAGVKVEPMDRSERLLQWLAPWERWQVLPERYLTNGPHVVVLCRYTGTGKGSGTPVDSEGAHFWTVRDGRAVRLEIFSSRELALEAAGIDPSASSHE